MDLKVCRNGHNYDGDKYRECPYCSKESSFNNVADYDDEVTVSVYAEDDIPTSDGSNAFRQEMRKEKMEVPDDEKTISFYSDDADTAPVTGHASSVKTRGFGPIVGWLVSVKGSNRGESFCLYTGKNSIGRSGENDIVLKEDGHISRTSQAIVIYEPKMKKFYAKPGEARGLFYLNGAVVLETSPMASHDILSIGETELIFVPLCGEQFDWDKKDGKENR